jgi:large subunit ribosomal protein L34e
MLDKRVTYKRRASYRTKSNRFRTVKTPGGKLAIQYIKKKTNGTKMAGVKAVRPSKFATLGRAKRTVSRAYGGVLTHQEVRER